VARCRSKWGRSIGSLPGVRAIAGNVVLFAHGHVLRALVAQWIGLPPRAGEHFLLDTGTLCVLSYYYQFPAVRVWNGALATTEKRQ
jgi:broad specificity phosphatase PhoE